MAASERVLRMKARAIARAACAAALLALANIAAAGETAFTAAGLERALAAGTPTIVHFRASWCPTCKAQQPIVDALLQEPKRKDVQLFAADYDTETVLKPRLPV